MFVALVQPTLGSKEESVFSMGFSDNLTTLTVCHDTYILRYANFFLDSDNNDNRTDGQINQSLYPLHIPGCKVIKAFGAGLCKDSPTDKIFQALCI